MKRNKLQFFILLIFIFVMQRSAVLNIEDEVYAFPFAAGFQVSEDQITDIGKFLTIVIPVFLLLFLFGGMFENIKSGYGKILIIREMRRTNLCVKQILNLYLGLAGCVLIQIVVFLNTWNGETNTVIKMLVLYYLNRSSTDAPGGSGTVHGFSLCQYNCIDLFYSLYFIRGQIYGAKQWNNLPLCNIS